jgi:g-D-glutamyl-meso-diaminopimelate peptidase
MKMEIRVRPGDTLSHYSHLFKVPLNLIIDSNPHVDPEHLKQGRKIKIPGRISVPYCVKYGDTFSKIAASKNIPLDALAVLNQIIDPKQMKIGETIFLPERVISTFTITNAAYDYHSMVRIIDSLKRVYPFITIKEIGKSVLGHSIQEIRVGKGEKKVHMNASFHANEWITTMVLLSLLNQYLLCLTNGSLLSGHKVCHLYEEVELSIVPMVNPDGVNLVLKGPPPGWEENVIGMNEGSDDFIHWKANIRGIDLNRQFPANWDLCRKNSPVHCPCPRDFPGNSSLTEPEAIAMAELVKNNSFDRIFAFHTQGEEFYWGYEGHEPVESEAMAEELERKSGYKAVRYVNSHAGYKDWFIQEFKRPGFTIELGRGINPLPLSQLPQILKCAEEIFAAALLY